MRVSKGLLSTIVGQLISLYRQANNTLPVIREVCRCNSINLVSIIYEIKFKKIIICKTALCYETQQGLPETKYEPWLVFEYMRNSIRVGETMLGKCM